MDSMDAMAGVLLIGMLVFSVLRGLRLQSGPSPTLEWLWELGTLRSTVWMVVAGVLVVLMFARIFSHVSIPEPATVGGRLLAISVLVLVATAVAAFLRVLGLWIGSEIKRRSRK